MEQYDTIAGEYRESRQLACRDALEKPTLLGMLGDVRGKSILDMGCGDGFYTRYLKRAGARKVTGVDISGEMIRLAQDEERLHPLGCIYRHHDAGTFEPDECVDIVLASYLLHYARTADDLRRLCESCCHALRPGGRIVGIIADVLNPREGLVSWKQYGIKVVYPGTARDGSVIRVQITNSDGNTFEFENYYHSPETYRMAFEEAGFPNFRWVPLSLNFAESGNPFWDDYMNRPYADAFFAFRSLH